jgi:predicted transcriptional regulator
MFGSFKIEVPETRKTIFQDNRLGRVDVSDSDSIQKWASVLGISEDELVNSVEKFGSVITDIRKGRRDRK